MRRIVFAVMIPALALAGWLRTYELGYLSIGYSGVQTTDGGYIVTGGYVINSMDYANLFLIKTDSTGDTMWTRTYGGEANDQGNCIQQTKDGGYIMLGFTNVEGDMWPAGDIWLLKTDSEGDTIWTRIYRGYNFPSGGWVEQTSDGGYIFTSNWDMAYLLLLKADKNGNTEWSKNYQWGSQQIETGYCVRQTWDGGYIVATNLGLFKTDENGDSLWLKPWISTEVEQTLDGGYNLPKGQNNDLWLIKTDEYGDTIWTRTYGDDDKEGGVSCQQTSDGGYIILGPKIIQKEFGENYNIWLLKTDPNGDTVWTRTFGGKRVDRGYRVQQTTDSGYVITGSSGSFSTSLGDAMLIKTDSLGYVGVSEPVTPVTHHDWEIPVSVGRQITLRYTDRPQGFAACIYDATGRKVDEVRSAEQSGAITWGEGMSPGVYFIREVSGTTSTTRKVILIR